MITPNWYFWTLGTSTSLCFLGGKLAKCNTLSGPVVLLSGIYPIKITYTYIHIYKCTHVHKGIFIQVIFITAKKKTREQPNFHQRHHGRHKQRETYHIAWKNDATELQERHSLQNL